MVLEHLVWHDFGLAELGGDHLGVDLVPVFPGDVSPHSVVAREGAMAEGTRHSDALVSLSDVGPKVSFVSIGSLAERAF